MTDTLRDKQRQLAREAILNAAADEIVERGLESLSLQAVATRAGVSHRTLYNYFETRERLLADLIQWSDDLTLKHGGHLVPRGLDTLPDLIREVWRSWEAQGTVYLAAALIGASSSDTAFSAGRKKRLRALESAVRTVRPDLDMTQRREVAAVFHAIASSAVYRRLTTEDGLTTERAGDLVGWVIATLRDALIAGSDPFQDPATTDDE